MFPNPQNNPIAILVQSAQRGEDYMNVARKMALSDPFIAQFVRLVEGKTPQQLETIAKNISKEQGIDLNQMIRSLGINNASFR